ncbi:MAG: quaternary ammonium transporter [Leptolyngbyaceae cyanobacterium SL_1_1]|nr:quaternary ammonium transporter [Leptolyngbyaceae cyanobacterium RM1_1_2]NJO11870.1 quaternary ammonium transporter [Leptolyngbyaceae cyanobacterium SL_1_1]
MFKPFRPLLLSLLALLTAFGIIACQGTPEAGGGGSDSSDPIRVGSKDFTEQLILGEMYAIALENAGFEVERKLNLGGTPVAQAALENKEIDLYPEYTGTGLLTVLKQPAESDQQAVYDTVSQQYQEKFDLVWLEPAPMNNTQALAMTQAQSEQLGIKTISEMAAQANSLVMIGPPEFEIREDGLVGLKQAYGNFELEAYKAVDAGLRYQGLVDGEADVAVAFGTDGEISAFDLVLLEDDKKLFPPYQVAPVVRQETLEANPKIADVLNGLAPLLTDETMQQLNYEVSNGGKEPATVAQEFLAASAVLQ